MKNLIQVSVLPLFVACLNINAQTKADEDAIRKLPQAHCDSWNKHDAHELAKLMADDGDFVTVATVYLHGRADYEKFHARLLSGRFHNSTFTPLETTVRFLRPDMAVVHWSWKMSGDINLDGTARTPRFGLMTLVVEKRDGAWQIVVAAASASRSRQPEPGQFAAFAAPSPVSCTVMVVA